MVRNDFRLRGKNIFLTYPQCTLSHEDLFNHLKTLHYDKRLERLLVAKELHADGGIHFHCFLGFAERFQTRRADYFDYQSHHPNTQCVRSPTAVTRYCCKDGEWFSEQRSPGNDDWYNWPVIVKRTWKEAYEAETEEEFRSIIASVSPRKAILYSQQIDRYAAKRFKTAIPDYIPRYTQFNNCTTGMHEWVAEHWAQPRPLGRPTSLCLVGDTQLGKTEWARHLGRHMYWNGMFDLSLWDDDARYAVFDDFRWDAFKFSYKQWIGAQQTFTLTDKYRKKRTVQWGNPIILLLNTEEYLVYSESWDKSWIKGNLKVIYLFDPLY